MIEPILMTCTRVLTYLGGMPLTNASGFFYRSNNGLFLATCRHVFLDEANGHRPDRLELTLHTDADNLTQTTGYSIPIYRDGRSVWRDGMDGGGPVDVAVIELDTEALPPTVALTAFTDANQIKSSDEVDIGANALILGFPLGFQDVLHHMPVARQAIVASSFGLRFQGAGYFLTDARTHRGLSGGPVVMRIAGEQDLPWRLIGVHSSRLDVSGRDKQVDEVLGLNCAWYADILELLTAS